jgi:hypothetical protein
MSNKPTNFTYIEALKVKQYEPTHEQTFRRVSKRSFHSNRMAKTTFLKPIKYVVKQTLSLYYKYKPEAQLITCVTRHFSNLLQQWGDNTSQMTKQLIQGLKTTHVSTPYTHVQHSHTNNFKQCGNKTTPRNMESLDRIFYQVARECLMAAVYLLPGLGSLLYGVYNVWNWSVQMTEHVNRNQLALCTKKFIEKKFWDWIETEI